MADLVAVQPLAGGRGRIRPSRGIPDQHISIWARVYRVAHSETRVDVDCAPTGREAGCRFGEDPTELRTSPPIGGCAAEANYHDP